MFKPKTPEEIEQIVNAVIIRELDEEFVPDFFLEAAKPLIEEAIQWQKDNPDKSALGNFRVDQKARHLAQQLIDSDQGEYYRLSDENFDRVELLEEAIALYSELGAEPSEEELCEEFEFTPDELAGLRAIQAFKRS